MPHALLLSGSRGQGHDVMAAACADSLHERGWTTSRVDAKQRPVLDAKQRPPHPRSGRETTSISAAHPGRETTSISRLTTGGGAGGSLVKKEQSKVPWSTPILEPVPGDYDRATLANGFGKNANQKGGEDAIMNEPHART